jgi:hypothetical protein
MSEQTLVDPPRPQYPFMKRFETLEEPPEGFNYFRCLHGDGGTMGFTTNPDVLPRLKAVAPSTISHGCKLSLPEIRAAKRKLWDEEWLYAFVNSEGRVGTGSEYTMSASCKFALSTVV